MIALGILSFFQITLIPGFVLLNIFKFKTRNRIQMMILSFGSSLSFNYFLVYILTILGIYKPVTIYLVFILEILLLIFILSRKKVGYYSSIPNQRKILSPRNQILYNLSILVIFIFVLFFITNIGKVFNQWDDVFSWNRWAIHWYTNRLPIETGFYPQLITANWSITYVFMNNPQIQLFAKSIMPLFSLAIIAIFFELYISKKKTTYLISLIIFGFVTLLYSFIHIQSGYVDIPVAFFSFLVFYLMIDQYNNPLELGKLFLIVLFASSAAMTKQAGFFILIFTFFWLLWTVFSKRESKKKTFCAIFVSISTIIIFLSWYLIKLYEVQGGVDFSNTSYLLHDIHGGLNYLERILSGLKKFPDFGIILLILIIFAIAGIFLKKYITVPILIILPYFLIWGLFFSYDRRNLTIIFPFLAFSSAFGISALVEKFRSTVNKKLSPKNRLKDAIYWIYLGLVFFISIVLILMEFLVKKMGSTIALLNLISKIRGYPIADIWSEKIDNILTILFYIGITLSLYGIYLILIREIFKKREKITINLKWVFVSFLILVVFVFIFVGLNNKKITEYQINQQKNLGNKKLNKLLYNYKDNNVINGRIITDYYWLSVLPGFYDNPKNIFIDNKVVQIISDVPPYSPFIEAIDSNTWGILISENYYSGPQFKDIISKKINSGEFKIIFIEEGYTIQKYYLIKIN